jgi:hypothetical protein
LAPAGFYRAKLVRFRGGKGEFPAREALILCLRVTNAGRKAAAHAAEAPSSAFAALSLRFSRFA